MKRSVSEFGEAQNRIGIKVMKSLHSVEQETTGKTSRLSDRLQLFTIGTKKHVQHAIGFLDGIKVLIGFLILFSSMYLIKIVSGIRDVPLEII